MNNHANSLRHPHMVFRDPSIRQNFRSMKLYAALIILVGITDIGIGWTSAPVALAGVFLQFVCVIIGALMNDESDGR